MRNEDFLEMLGNIDDSIIDECTSAPVVTKKPHNIKYITTLAAVFLLTVCAVLISRIVPEGLLTGFVGEDYTTSENNETESSEFAEESSSEIHSGETSVTEETSSSVAVTVIETTVSPVPENTTVSGTTEPSEETTATDLPSQAKGPYFVEVPYENLLFAGTDGMPDDYPDRKRVTWQELLRIYATVIIPYSVGKYFPGLQSLFNDVGLSISDNKNTGDESTFSFTLPDNSTLNINASNRSLKLSEAEEENMGFASEIDGAYVLLLKGYNAENEMIFSAYFEKNGVNFRITQHGSSLSEEDFLTIIKSLI